MKDGERYLQLKTLQDIEGAFYDEKKFFILLRNKLVPFLLTTILMLSDQQKLEYLNKGMFTKRDLY